MNTKQTITVWDGVKIGCGIFIVLPAILLVATILFRNRPSDPLRKINQHT